jgi:hypothetical protein
MQRAIVAHAVSVADRGFQVALISYVEDTFRFRVFGPNIASRRNKAVQQWKTMFTVWVGGYGPGETILLREDVALVFFLSHIHASPTSAYRNVMMGYHVFDPV